MPHPKNRLKLTGDLHPPELEESWAPDAGAPEIFETEAAQRSEILHQAGADGHPLRRRIVRRESIETRPLLVLGIAFALMVLVTKLSRR